MATYVQNIDVENRQGKLTTLAIVVEANSAATAAVAAKASIEATNPELRIIKYGAAAQGHDLLGRGRVLRRRRDDRRRHHEGHRMSRASTGEFNLVAPTPNFGLKPGQDKRMADLHAAIYGNPGTESPTGMRNLTPAESRTNETWSWDPDLGTYVSPSFPEGIE
jgi:hypothetical protein